MISLILAISVLNAAPVVNKKIKPTVSEISKEQKLEKLNKALDQLCIKFSESFDKKVGVSAVFVSSTTKPGDVGFATFEYGESESFGLLLLWRDGSWKFLPEDFKQVALSQ